MADRRDRVLDIAVAVNSAESLDDLIRVVMHRVGELMPYDRSSIALLDPSRRRLIIRDLTTSDEHEDSSGDLGKRVPIDEANVLGWVFLNGRPHHRRSISEDDAYRPQQTGREAESHIIAPLIGRAETLGVLNVGRYAPGAFDESDVPLFAGYARLTAVAIENLRAYEQARESSIRDGLTGAFNHRHFKEELKRETNRVVRYGGTISLLLLDIDHFKGFNDRYGHQTGDRILMQTVRLLSEQLRPSDQVFRYGGEEFAVLLPSTGGDEACVVADKLLALLRTENLYRPDRSTLHRITASAGVATVPLDACTPDAIIACADQALYRAKAGGRDRFVSFSGIPEVHSPGDTADTTASIPDFLFSGMSTGSPLPQCQNQRVVRWADLLGGNLGLGKEQRVNLRIAAYYHDIGEAGIPREILQKPGPLDARERALVRAHPVVGESLPSRIVRVGEVLMAVLHHHERFDGTGYPRGLAGERIPLLARIVAVAEVFDALISDRPYRAAYDASKAYEILENSAGFHLDPELVARFVKIHSGRASVLSGGIG